jgi:trigger factor
MKNKITASILALCLILTMSGCGGESKVYDFDLSEYIEVGAYTGLDVVYEEVTVTPEDVDAAIEGILNAAAKPARITTGKVYNGDTVNIDFSGSIDGVLFDGGTAVGQNLLLGSGNMIPGFEDQIMGQTIGSSFSIDVTFPADYHAETLRGAEAVFDITIHYKEGDLVVPEFSENFVRTNSEYKNIEEYLGALESKIYEEKEKQELTRVQNEVWLKVVEASEVISYPEKEVQRKIDQNYEYYQSYASYYNMEMEEFLTSYVGMNEEEFEDYVKQQAEVVVKQEMILYTIARNEGIEISDQEYKEGIMEMLAEEGFSSQDEFKQAYGESFEDTVGKDNILMTLLLKKVIDWLVETNVTFPA